jgi:hypothetical protein
MSKSQRINWFGFAGGITTIIVVFVSMLYPWWQLTVGELFKTNASPVNANLAFGQCFYDTHHLGTKHSESADAGLKWHSNADLFNNTNQNVFQRPSEFLLQEAAFFTRIFRGWSFRCNADSSSSAQHQCAVSRVSQSYPSRFSNSRIER